MSERTLSKSDFKIARSCAAKLYFREHRYPDNLASNPYLMLLAEGGYMVEALAKAQFPDGIQLHYGADPAADFARTMAHLEADRVTLFEATLLAGRRMARVDILEKNGSMIRLIEVKSKSFDGAAHVSSLASGGAGAFRKKKSPHEVLGDWLEKIEDVTYQTLLAEALLPGTSIHPCLALVDKSKTAALDRIPDLFEIVVADDPTAGRRVETARYTGTAEELARLDLLTVVDVSREVEAVRTEVAEAAARFERLLDAPLETFLDLVERGSHCRDCEYRVPGAPNGFGECWGEMAAPVPHVLDLFSAGKAKAPDGRALIDWAVSERRTGLLDVPVDGLKKADDSIGPEAARQRRQIEYTRRNERFFSEELIERVRALRGPLHFIDFEGSRLALPYHAGMRPYGNVAFQWSCHTVGRVGAAPSHAEWLNNTDVWPNERFVESLRDAIGDDAPVLTWSPYEGVTLKQIAEDLARLDRNRPDLIAWIQHVIDARIVDLHAWCRDGYFIPSMKGKTGIKYVLDAIWEVDPEMRAQCEAWSGLAADPRRGPYASLPPVIIAGIEQLVHEGTGAMRAYQEMMYGTNRHDPAARAAWAALLKQYCRLDTLSMVLIVEHWRRAARE